MSHTEPPAKATPVIQTIVVPDKIYHAAIRANLNLMDLTVFGKLRQIASFEDIALFAALNDTLAIGSSFIATNILKNVVSLGDGNETEFNAVFDRMAKTEEIMRLAQSSIEPVNDTFGQMLAMQNNFGDAVTVDSKSLRNTLGSPLDQNEDSTYQLKTSGSNVFVVVSNGFNKYVGAQRNKEASNLFIKSFLTLCARQFNPPEVARHPLFKPFLHSIAG